MKKAILLDFKKFKKAGGADKRKGYSYYNEGVYFYGKDQNDKALERYLKAEKSGYESVDMFCDMSWLYGELGDWKKAEYYANKSIKLDRNFGRSYILLGNVYYAKENFNKALDLYLKADSLEFNDVPTLARMVDLLLDKKNYFKASEITMKALRFIPNDSELNSLMGRIYLEQNEYKTALKYYKRSEEKSMPEFWIYFSIAVCYYYLKEFKNALEYSNKMIFADKENYVGYEVKASTYFDMKIYDKAFDNFNKAIELGLDDPESYLRLSYIYVFEKKNYTSGLECVEKVLKINPKDSIAMWAKADIYRNLKDYKNSLKYYKKSYKYASIKDLDESFFKEWASVYFDLNKYKLALKTCDIGLELFPRSTVLIDYIKAVKEKMAK